MTAPLLDANTLADFRSMQAGSMPSTCDLIAFAQARTATGGTGLTPFIVASVPCRLYQPSGLIVVQAEQLTPTGSYVVVMPADTDTTGIQRLTVRGVTDDVAWSVQLVVTGTDEPRSYSASRRLRARLATDVITPPALVETVVITEVVPGSGTIYPQAVSGALALAGGLGMTA